MRGNHVAIGFSARIIIRPATDDDFEDIIALGVKCLGRRGDQRDRDFFRWKHHENPFGRSPAWVAETEGRLAGFRTFLRWRFVHGTTGESLEMVRAVDTATDPDFQGRGIFRELTMTAVEALAASGIDAVFNTPNDKSRPGYLKMGWVELGRPTVRIRPHSVRGLPRIAGARAPAELWPDEVPTGGDAVTDLPEQVFPERPTWRTDRTVAFRSWRYRFAPLGYRQAQDGSGGSVYRLRQRGAARELSICEVHGDRPGLDGGIRRRADYALSVGTRTGSTFGVPLPGQGPVVTWRPLTDSHAPMIEELDLGMSDLELF